MYSTLKTRHIQFKPEVRMNVYSLQPKMTNALRAGLRTAPELVNNVMVITSMDDGDHMENSKHYEGFGFDVRTHGHRPGGIFAPRGSGFSAETLCDQAARAWAGRWQTLLGPSYLVLAETEKVHIHVQWGRRAG